MTDFFLSLYEWFGLIFFYSQDMSNLIAGYGCNSLSDEGLPTINIVGIILLFSVLLTYLFMYHLLNSAKYNKVTHWWIVAFILFLFNFLVAFVMSWNIVNAMTDMACELSMGDCIGFALSNSIWSLVLFGVISSLPWPRKFSSNLCETTFWKPKP